MTDEVEVQYKCTGVYNGKAESAIRWDDPDLSIEWPLKDICISEKDRRAQSFAQWLASPQSSNFTYYPEAVTTY